MEQKKKVSHYVNGKTEKILRNSTVDQFFLSPTKNKNSQEKKRDDDAIEHKRPKKPEEYFFIPDVVEQKTIKKPEEFFFVPDLIKQETPQKLEDFFFVPDLVEQKSPKNKKEYNNIRKRKDENVIDIDSFLSIEKKYDLILADPPWRYERTYGAGIAEDKYPTLSTEDIMSLPVWQIAARDCILLLWITNPKLPQGFKVMKHWGFTYKNTGLQWIKIAKGGQIRKICGSWIRGCSETCYIATRGNGDEFFEKYDSVAKSPGSLYLGVRGHPWKKFTDSRAVSTYVETELEFEETKKKAQDSEEEKFGETVSRYVGPDMASGDLDCFYATIRRHSEKPMEEFISRLRQYFGKNYESMRKIELFARKAQPGWDCWGNEIGKKDDRVAQIISGYITWDNYKKNLEEKTNAIVNTHNSITSKNKKRKFKHDTRKDDHIKKQTKLL